MELDRISMALSDMKDIAIRMNEEMKYQEQIIDELVVVCSHLVMKATCC